MSNTWGITEVIKNQQIWVPTTKHWKLGRLGKNNATADPCREKRLFWLQLRSSDIEFLLFMAGTVVRQGRLSTGLSPQPTLVSLLWEVSQVGKSGSLGVSLSRAPSAGVCAARHSVSQETREDVTAFL